MQNKLLSKAERAARKAALRNATADLKPILATADAKAADAAAEKQAVAAVAAVTFADMRLAGRINERAAGTYPGGNLSDRDILFLAYFASVATDDNGTLPDDIVNHYAYGRRASNFKAGGPVTRLKNAGLITFAPSGAFVLSPRALSIGRAAADMPTSPVTAIAAGRAAAEA
jgi:polygalacturonase